MSGGKLIVLGIKDKAGNTASGLMVFPLGPITIYPHADLVLILEVKDLHKYYNSVDEDMVLSRSYTFTPFKSVLIKDLGETGYILGIK